MTDIHTYTPKKQLICFVEGDGEIKAIPILIKKLRNHFTPDCHLVFKECFTLPGKGKDAFLSPVRSADVQKQLEKARIKGTHFLFIMDSDGNCPIDLTQRVRGIIDDKNVLSKDCYGIVIAHYEYETWLVASAPSLDGECSFSYNPLASRDFNHVHASDEQRAKGTKSWLVSRIHGTSKYHEILHQKQLTEKIDIELARQNSRSFRKLCTEWQRLAAHADSGRNA